MCSYEETVGYPYFHGALLLKELWEKKYILQSCSPNDLEKKNCGCYATISWKMTRDNGFCLMRTLMNDLDLGFHREDLALFLG